jgi:hypothetical protein
MGFVSDQPAPNWEHGLLTGNGTLGAVILGRPHEETLFLSHAGLYLPNKHSPEYMRMAGRLSEIRRQCLAGNYKAAADEITAARAEHRYSDARDPFIAAFSLHIRQPAATLARYQRRVDYLTAEAAVTFTDERGTFQRTAFASRSGDVLVLRLAGDGKQTASFSFAALPAANEAEAKLVKENVTADTGVQDGLLCFRAEFANRNAFNPHSGYFGLGRIVTRGGTRTETADTITIADADEILLLVKIRPLRHGERAEDVWAATALALTAQPTDYARLLAPHAALHGELMSRVQFSLGVPAEERAKSTERLNHDSREAVAPLAKVERAFDAGRYNILCSTGYNPPNLQGLWSGTWAAPWSGSFTTNGNLQAAVAFNLMGNTPELMEPFFRYYEQRLDGFRRNAKDFFGMRGFHVPAQLTVSPLSTDFSVRHPHVLWHSGAAWAAAFYADYYRYTGDRRFLAERAYPFMKEAAAFLEDFLTVKDAAGKLVFVPSYSPENRPKSTEQATSINATMDISATRQLLRNAISAAKILGRDEALQATWAELMAQLPDYEIAPDGSFREWLWPGLEEQHHHRHASHLYALYDEMPAEILDRPELVRAIERSITLRYEFHRRTGVMAFGLVQLGLAAAHIRHAGLTEDITHFLAQHYWSTGMASFHNRDALFNMDISGGFPYLCASALVYADPGLVRLFPARPASWARGSIGGLRLRGGIVLKNLTWDADATTCVLMADHDQSIRLECPGRAPRTIELRAKHPTTIEL